MTASSSDASPSESRRMGVAPPPWTTDLGPVTRARVAVWRKAAETRHIAAHRSLEERARPLLDLAPGITAVVLAGRRPSALERCLRSLAGQTLDGRQFEVVVVVDADVTGLAATVDAVCAGQPELTLRVVRLAGARPGWARIAGAAAATREYTTIVLGEDRVSPSYLAVLLASAGPTVVPTVPVEDAGGTRSAGHPPSDSDPVRAAVALDGAKAVPTVLIRDLSDRDGVGHDGDELFWTTLIVRHGLDVRPCPVTTGATYHRMRDLGERDAIPVDDGAMRNRVESMSRLEDLAAQAHGSGLRFVRERIEEHAAVLNSRLRERTDDHGRLVELLDRQAVGLPYDRINTGLARGLVVAYAFPPYADGSAIVMAKRVRARGEIVDVVSNAMGGIRVSDPSLQRISGPFVDRHARLATPTYFSSWGSMERFAVAGLDTIRRWESAGASYQTVYSRAHFAASHFLAAAYKLSRPDVRWIAEFSDPLSRDVHDHERGTPVRRGPFLRSLRAGLRRRGLPVPPSRNCFVWCEEIAYALADELLFTNEHQLEHMLSYCSNPELARVARGKAIIEPHPTLPPPFYSIADSHYALEADRVHLAYFGNFYATRGLGDLLGALAEADAAVRGRCRLHVFTSNPDELARQVEELAVSDCVVVGPYVPYLEFLRLTTRFDCLVVNDAATGTSHQRNPFLPSKWSDYRGSGTPVWGLVEPGSRLSDQDLTYRSTVGDVPAAGRVLARLVRASVTVPEGPQGRAGWPVGTVTECYAPPPPNPRTPHAPRTPWKR